ncbi:LysR substrate-binding domain-containing protein [Escherichia coli]
MPVAVAKKLVIPQLPAFLQQYPGIELEHSSDDRLVDVVREGFDCVVRVGTLKDSGLIARPLGKANANQLRQPAVPDALRLSAIAGRSRRSRDHHRYTPPNLGVRPLGFEVVSDGGRWVKAGGVLTVNSTETYQASCLAGLGIIQVPRVGVREVLRSGELIEILPHYRAEPLPVSLIYRHRQGSSRGGYICLWSGSAG